MRFVHKPIMMTAVEWDGKTSTIRKMLALGIDFRTTSLQTVRGQVRVGYVIVNRNRTTVVVDLHHYVTKGPDGWPRVLTPREMEDWEPAPAVPRKRTPEPVVMMTEADLPEPDRTLSTSEPVDGIYRVEGLDESDTAAAGIANAALVQAALDRAAADEYPPPQAPQGPSPAFLAWYSAQCKRLDL